ncbi:hypothetical protein CTAM01_02945 [Colletotrichum tamarilloi]|uniref:Ubiquinol-cytochrome-c reductase cytochrome c1 n=1 Tax=Colletotrichum tamarilloi TaxID=1209934 RepID=A0ABQ9RKN8_9PEZI|nr:uncharacterized protein CTAM01_02945 [Colletotrichum tamarilloi]KAK1506613.1 hypothetical protein CTAM01_02945 [Colletotrichum tamarilloi]
MHRFMTDGLENDDKYRMVEDELVTIAGHFTAHLHAAEYQRLKAQTRTQNAETIKTISRPVVGSLTELARKRQEELLRKRKQREALRRAKRDAGRDDEETGDETSVPWRGTSLQGLMHSPKKKEVPLMALTRTDSGVRTSASGLFGGVVRSSQSKRPAAPAKRSTPVDETTTEDESDDLGGPVKASVRRDTIHIHFINKLLALQNQTSHPQHPSEIRQETSQPPSMASTMEEEIYLAMQHVFSKKHAEIRHPKPIQRRIHACLGPAIKALDLKYTRPVVVSTCQKLLEEKIFETKWKAEQRFPQLFQQLPASAQVVATPANAPETPEATRQEIDWKEKIGALISERKAERTSRLQAAIVGPGRDAEGSMAVPGSYTSQATADVGDAASITTSSDTVIPESTATATARQPPIETADFPVLSTAFLSYEAQHALFAKIQSLLEKACFDYAKQAHPKILEAGQWESPERVELQKWMWIFKNEVFDTFQAETVPPPHTDWHAFFESIKQIRHKAVHREVLCVADVKAYLADAESLAKLLRQDECLAKLGFLREETEMVLAVSERKKDGLAVKYQAKFDEIGVRRKELDESERRTREEMVREHRMMQSDLGFGFKLAVSEMKETVVPGKGGEVGGDKEEGAGPWRLIDGFWKLVSGW